MLLIATQPTGSSSPVYPDSSVLPQQKKKEGKRRGKRKRTRNRERGLSFHFIEELLFKLRF